MKKKIQFNDQFQSSRKNVDPEFLRELEAKLVEIVKEIERVRKPPSTTFQFGVPFSRPPGVETGHAVRCLANQTIVLADNSSTSTAADGVVIATSKSVAIVSSCYPGLVKLNLALDRGDNADNRLYLGKDGLVTDQITDLVETTTVNGVTRTKLKPGVAFIQKIGVRINEKFAERCDSMLTVDRPDARP